MRASGYRRPCSDAPSGQRNQPTTSAIMSVLPAELYKLTLCCRPIFTITRFGTGLARHEVQVRRGIRARAARRDTCVAKPAAVGLVTVTFITTAVASAGHRAVAGDGEVAGLVRALHGDANALPYRESRSRLGVAAGVNSLSAVVPPYQPTTSTTRSVVPASL